MFRLLFVGLLATAVSGCAQQASDVTSSSADSITATSFNTAGAPTVEFSVPDMMCPEGCGAAVKEILAKQSGAKDVLVDFDAKKAIVAVDKEQFNTAEALAALVDHQFGNSALKNGDAVDAGAKPQAADAPVVQ